MVTSSSYIARWGTTRARATRPSLAGSFAPEVVEGRPLPRARFADYHDDPRHAIERTDGPGSRISPMENGFDCARTRSWATLADVGRPPCSETVGHLSRLVADARSHARLSRERRTGFEVRARAGAARGSQSQGTTMNAPASLLVLLLSLLVTPASDPIVVADFEGPDYGAWKATGTAFGPGPARGTLPNQMHVDGFQGQGLVNSFRGGDATTGTLTSPPFRVERRFLTFLIGGGGWEGETCMNLVVDGAVVRTATGPNIIPGGSERLAPAAWDVAEFAGREAVIVVVDSRKGGWGHINVDHLVLTDDRGGAPLATPSAPPEKDVARELVAYKKLLHFPVKTGARKRRLTVSVEGMPVRRFEVELADAAPDWWAPLDIGAWEGKTLRLVADALPKGSKALESVRQSNTLLGADDLYREPLRPQLQFSPRRGWTNDPNGLVYFNGEWHLFFQHNPYGWDWGNMHWGHATSKDLVHWQEHGEALYPDDLGPMFSGSAVVDRQNTSGFGKDGRPPLVLIYTAAGNPTVQCLAYSLDGRTFTKYAGNPVVAQVAPGNRDPKVFWHEPSGQWVMVLYVGLPKPGGSDAKPSPGVEHTVHILTSPNLKDWTLRSRISGLFECPDLFELAVDGDAKARRWVLSAASGEYFLGAFDGRTFTPETPKLPGPAGKAYYAAQTFSNVPDGRRIEIGWGRAPSPGMPFNQLLTFPCTLTLRQTPAGPRLARTPVKELTTLRARSWIFQQAELAPDSPNPLTDVRGELLEVDVDLKPAGGSEVVLNVRGLEIRYDAARQAITAGGITVSAPTRDGHQRLAVFTDRTMFSLFASDGLVYLPIPRIAKESDLGVTLQVKRGAASVRAEVYALKSIWP